MNGVHLLDGMPQTLVHEVEEGATRIAEAVENAGARAGARMAKGAGQMAKGAGQAGGIASELSGQLKGRVAHSPLDLKDAKLAVKDAKLTVKEAKLSLRERLMRSMAPTARRRGRLSAGTDAMLKAQLARTSRELAHESSDLNAAVESLNRIIRANRRAAAKSRTRLLGGLAIGATLMYHLDAEHGRERRAATARLLTSMARGQSEPPSALG